MTVRNPLVRVPGGLPEIRELPSGDTLAGAPPGFVYGTALFDHYTDTGNGTTVETDLYSDTLAASQFAANGDKILATYAGIFVSSATASREVRLYFGGTKFFDSAALTVAAAVQWELQVLIIRVSSTVVRCTASWTSTGETAVAAASQSAYTEITGLTLSATNILKITGQAAGAGAATNDIVAKLGSVQYIPAA